MTTGNILFQILNADVFSEASGILLKNKKLEVTIWKSFESSLSFNHFVPLCLFLVGHNKKVISMCG